ncbi:MAG TPA: DUF5683 domain-containing protein [Bacteroidales bacterium]|nr:DUF5683 domain-containing protein [Bacteroidales bacterium]
MCVITCGAWSQDSIPVMAEKAKSYTLEPIRATMYAAALPGLGQIYNRKFWKLPIVYAGFGALGYAASFNGSNYNAFINAYQDFIDLVPETNSYLDIRGMNNLNPEDYDPVLHPETYNPSTEAWVTTQLLNGVEYYRRYRDLSYIGIVAWYLVTIIDAQVDASLFDYDITDDLKALLVPVTVSPYGLAPGLTLTLTRTF